MSRLVSIEQVAGKEFDFVIIGGGTAGLVVADKLSKSTNKSVLVLEEGQPNLNDPDILRPVRNGKNFGNDKYSWNLKTSAQLFTNNRVHVWQRGRGLGGSSNINFSVYTKPPADDIDAIGRLGSPGVNWEVFNRVMNKVEGFVSSTGDISARDGSVDGLDTLGRDGPLKVSLHSASPLQRRIQAAFNDAGIPNAPDPYGGDPRGFFTAAATWDPTTDTRSYAVSAFLASNEDRPNLAILTAACTHCICTDQTSSGHITATAVEFSHLGTRYTVRAAQEVVVCAGTLHSPKVLELSGIGDPTILRNVGIPVRVDLPGVGANLQEHVNIGLSLELKEGVETDAVDFYQLQKSSNQSLGAAAGPTSRPTWGIAPVTLDMVSLRGGQLRAGLREAITQKWESYPPGLQRQYELQVKRMQKGGVECEIATVTGLTSSSQSPNPAVPGKKYLSLATVLLHPFSRGTIHIVSADPAVAPEVDPHYFEEDIDLQIMVEGLRMIRSVAAQPPLKDICTRELNPGADCVTDDAIRSYIKNYMRTTWHTSSSCSMLPRDLGGVVGPDFKVYGTSNIRVVDLSVMPIQVASHTQCMAYAIGGYAAEIILADRLLPVRGD